MNDEFLYKRQETPDPVFMVELHNNLQIMAVPQKSKRKNGQNRFYWKAVAAVFVLTIMSLVILSQQRLREAIVNIFVDDPYYDLLMAAYYDYGFELPPVPERYHFSFVNTVNSGIASRHYAIETSWQNSDKTCTISLRADFTYYSSAYEIWPDTSEWQLLDGDEVIILDNIPILLGGDTFDLNPNRLTMSWTIPNQTYYNLQSSRACLSREEYIAIAQSTLP